MALSTRLSNYRAIREAFLWGISGFEHPRIPIEFVKISFERNPILKITNSIEFVCPSHLFECLPEKYCINFLSVCDGIVDCKSGNDEENCNLGRQFVCSPERFIQLQLVCNHREDCPNGIDEKGCGDCIDQNMVCNNEKNCPDGSDEFCSEQCGKSQIKCDNKCINSRNYCDSKVDCPNDILEERGTCLEEIRKIAGKSLVCSNDFQKSLQRLFYNRNRNFTKCRIVYNSMGELLTKIHYPYFDLEDCKDFKCNMGEYQCDKSNYCVPIQYVCDGINHCTYGDDESGCSNVF
ncbi:DgyrCDS3226 [Dimorphilus gyrociliatus]|uniref:DgyrCDS3226 n=1 Tax=Dimorphilus gyrociliatus TaxID=2664684 RepID=A0A7I8VED1_9ANNE|nr:DgyrCDS3226 [Dimorphilus gyrociliatus]